jgi:hypothetical protein
MKQSHTFAAHWLSADPVVDPVWRADVERWRQAGPARLLAAAGG